MKRKWGKSVTYADDATILTNLDKKVIKRIIEIYQEHLKRSGLRINAAKTEVYVVQEKLKNKVKEITQELKMKNTTELIVRYLGHKFKPLEVENKDRLDRAFRTIKWLTSKFNRTQNVTLMGRIVNSSALITTPIRF